MHRLTQLAYTHHAYQPGFGFHHGYGGYGGGYGGGIGNMVVSALVHSLIYGLVFRLMRHLTLSEAVLLVVTALVLLWMWSRNRERRGW